MKKFIGFTGAFVAAITLFSFSTAEAKKAEYNEVGYRSLSTELVAGTFQRYENGQYTPDKGTWSTKKEVWGLTGESGSLNEIEKALK